MGFRFVAVLLIASLCTAQTPAPAPSSAPSAAPPPITVAPGTAVPLTLLNPIRSRTTKPGDAIRAVVAFPVTVGTQVAIPAGTYAPLEGARIPRQRTSAYLASHFYKELTPNCHQNGDHSWLGSGSEPPRSFYPTYRGRRPRAMSGKRRPLYSIAGRRRPLSSSAGRRRPLRSISGRK